MHSDDRTETTMQNETMTRWEAVDALDDLRERRDAAVSMLTGLGGMTPGTREVVDTVIDLLEDDDG